MTTPSEREARASLQTTASRIMQLGGTALRTAAGDVRADDIRTILAALDKANERADRSDSAWSQCNEDGKAQVAEIATLREQLEKAERGRDEARTDAEHEKQLRANAEFAYGYGSPFEPTGVKRGMEIIALRAEVARLREHAAALAEEVRASRHKWPKPEKRDGPWEHGYGCPREAATTENGPCECGQWSAIDAVQAARAKVDASGALVQEEQGREAPQ